MAPSCVRALLTFGAALFAINTRAQTPAELLDNAKLAVVKLEAAGRWKKDKTARREFGTGFLFHKEGFVLTAAHVIGDADEWLEADGGATITRKVTVYRKLPNLANAQAQDAIVVYHDKQLDIALLRIACEPECRTVRFGNSSLVSDDTMVQVMAWGTRDKVEAFGWTKMLNRCDFKYFCLFKFNQNAVTKGDSGAPLFNDKLEVVGMVKSDSADAKGDVLATPINLSASLRLLADMEQPETRERFSVVQQSLDNLQKLAEDLRQNIRPLVGWTPIVTASGMTEKYLNVYIVRDFESQYVPEEIRVTVYPAWKVSPKSGDQSKPAEMNAYQAKVQDISFNADSDAATIQKSIKEKTAISKPFESSFKAILKSKYKFSDSTLDSLTIIGADVEIKWKLPRSEAWKDRVQTLGSAQ